MTFSSGVYDPRYTEPLSRPTLEVGFNKKINDSETMFVILLGYLNGDVRATSYNGERPNFVEGVAPNIAWARKTDFLALTDKRRPEPYGDCVSVRPIGEFSRLHHRLGISLSGDVDGRGKYTSSPQVLAFEMMGQAEMIATAVGVSSVLTRMAMSPAVMVMTDINII